MDTALNTQSPIIHALAKILHDLPTDWLKLTTHRLDIYNESQAKSDFIRSFESLIDSGEVSAAGLAALPTAYDYIRLGHQLSSVLEWVLADINGVSAPQVITFASHTMPILAFLRADAINDNHTHIYHDGGVNPLLDEARLQSVYGYHYSCQQVASIDDIRQHEHGTVVFVTQQAMNQAMPSNPHVDASINLVPEMGSVVLIHGDAVVASEKVQAVQHVRRRETIAMSPLNCFKALQQLCGESVVPEELVPHAPSTVKQCIQDNTGSTSEPLVASSGLSIQYAILMGLVEAAKAEHPGQAIHLILPPNCYGGTNDQTRRVAALIPEAEVVDLPVDGGADLVQSLEATLQAAAHANAVPIVLAEIPTNPRVEVPDMVMLGETLHKVRQNPNGDPAASPTFIVDQTFCPDVLLLGQDSNLAAVKTLSFSSGSKFPSGGRCIAGYCAANATAAHLMPLIEAHLQLSDNQADAQQMNILAEIMPSMPERIEQAFQNTRDFVNRIQMLLPESKMFYVTDEIAAQGFKPSVFSLDLPVQAETPEARQTAQKKLNKDLIQFMIERHPESCKNCVSYGQLKGSYWTIPATSTQGTTKEADKDYVVRVSLAPDVNVDQLADSFEVFCRDRGLICAA